MTKIKNESGQNPIEAANLIAKFITDPLLIITKIYIRY